MRMSRTQQQNPLGELFRLVDNTPLCDVDHDHIRRELDRIKGDNQPYGTARKQHGEIIRLCRTLLRLLPDKDPLAPPLKARMALSQQLALSNEPLTQAQVRSRRFAQQCEILALLDWSGSTIDAIVPLFRVASVYVFGNRPEPGRAKIVIQAYRKNRLNREIVLSTAIEL
jgi:hypothetical protein